MSREIFRFELEGLDEIMRGLDRAEKEIDKRLEKALIEAALQVEADAKTLAPVESRDLEAAIHADDHVKVNGSEVSIEIGITGEVAEYAIPQHEGFIKKDGKVITFSPGPETLAKGSHKGYPAGKKFLENALKINEKSVLEILADELNLNKK